MKNILVFFGGKSCEHDVSVVTGVLTLNLIDKTKYNLYPVYIHNDGEWYTGESLFDVSFYKNFNKKVLKKVTLLSNGNALYRKGKFLKKICEVDCAVNCMHGLNGEDGSLSGLIKLHNIPFASPDLFQSSLAIDKHFTKIVLKGLGVSTLPYFLIVKKLYESQKETLINSLEEELSYPLIVKPCNLGSSIGISTAKDRCELKRAIKQAFLYDDKLLVEPMLENFTELNCAVYSADEKTVVSQIEKPISSNEILTFIDKYEGFKGGSMREFPAKIPKKTAEKVMSISKKIYETLGFSGIIRIDYLLCDNKVYLNEINTVPGSLSYYLFVDSLKDFTMLLTSLIETAIKNYENYTSRNFEYKSSVLDINGIKNGK